MSTFYIPASDGFYGFGTNNGEARLRFAVERTYNAAANTSALSIGLQAHGSSTIYSGAYSLQAGTISAQGNVLHSFASDGYTVSLGSGSDADTWYDVQYNGAPARWSYTLPHAADGTAALTLAIGGGLNLYRYVSASVGGKSVRFDDASGSQSFSEPHASTIVSCPSSAATQGSIALTMSRASTAFYHKATVRDSQSRTLYTSAAFASSLSIPVSRSWFNNYSSATSFTASVSVQTYTSSACTTAVGSPVTRSVTITADSGMIPALASGFASAAPLGNPAGFSGYIQGVSRARVTLNAAKVTHAAGASLKSYKVVCQGYTGSGTGTSYDTKVLTGTASITITVTVTDTRDRTASTTLSVTPMAYAAPTLSGVSVFRCTQAGAASEDGTYFSAKATGTCASLNGQNSVTLTVNIRRIGGAWSGESILTSGTPRILGGALDPDVSYEVFIRAVDSLGSRVPALVTLPTRKWAMKFRPTGNGVAFGKAAERDKALELPEDWTIYFGSVPMKAKTWTLLGTAEGTSPVSLPASVSDNTELLAEVEYGYNNLYFSFPLALAQLRQNLQIYTQGYYDSGTSHCVVQIAASWTQVKVVTLRIAGGDYTARAVLRAYIK